jgi:LPXTG-motif cell wall-anchored protein
MVTRTWWLDAALKGPESIMANTRPSNRRAAVVGLAGLALGIAVWSGVAAAMNETGSAIQEDSECVSCDETTTTLAPTTTTVATTTTMEETTTTVQETTTTVAPTTTTVVDNTTTTHPTTTTDPTTTTEAVTTTSEGGGVNAASTSTPDSPQTMGQLPRTGDDPWVLALIGVGLLGMGSAFTVMSRREVYAWYRD